LITRNKRHPGLLKISSALNNAAAVHSIPKKDTNIRKAVALVVNGQPKDSIVRLAVPARVVVADLARPSLSGVGYEVL